MSTLFHLNRNNKTSTLQQQIRGQLVDAILGDYFPEDKPLPSSRSLAKSLKVARNTIVLVYEELAADGYLISKQRCGYFIDPNFNYSQLSTKPRPQLHKPDKHNLDKSVDKVSWQEKLKVTILSATPQNLPNNWQKYEYPFLYAQLDSKLFPRDNWRKCWRDAASVKSVRQWSSDNFDNDDPLLIDQIQKRILPNRGIQVDSEEILITIGSQQAIYLLAQLLINETSNFGIEQPGYTSAAHTAKLFKANILPLEIDSQGLCVTEQLDNCDLVYTTPSYQCPTTVTMPLARREALLKKAASSDFLIIEDDYEMEINYGTTPIPALKSLDTQDRVLYIGSLSKTLAPGLRIGFMVGPAALIKYAKNLRQLMVRHPPLNNQRAVALFLAQGYHDSLLRKLTRTFQERREIIANSMREHLPVLHFDLNEGSSIWCHLPSHIDTQQLQQRCLDNGVLIHIAQQYYLEEQLSANAIKLGFSAIETHTIAAGIEILAAQYNSFELAN
ncbi:MAG: PLP-dependent aminotransferase family protein [Oceanospirillaceae bacterium]